MRGAHHDLLQRCREEYNTRRSSDGETCKNYEALFAVIAKFECAWFASIGSSFAILRAHERENTLHISNLSALSAAICEHLKQDVSGDSIAFYANYPRMSPQEQQEICARAAARMMWRRPTAEQRAYAETLAAMSAEVSAQTTRTRRS